MDPDNHHNTANTHLTSANPKTKEHTMTTGYTTDHSTLTNPSNLCPAEDQLVKNLEKVPDRTSGLSNASNNCGQANSREETQADLIARVKDTIHKQRQERQQWSNDTGTADNTNTQENINANTNTHDHNTSNRNGTNSNAHKTEKIIQWNVNGFYTRLDDIKLLVEEYDPTVLCLQETRFNKKDRAKLSGFRAFLDSKDTRNRGVAILVRRDTTAERVELYTELNAVAVRVGFDKPITVCSLYVAPDQGATKEQIVGLANQLTAPYIIAGDMNAHNPIWGSLTQNQMGGIFEEFVEEKGMVILNTGEMTHYSIAYGTLSAIDLTVATADVALELGWHVVDDLHNSDHYPIITSVDTSKSFPSLRKRWRMETANWDGFRRYIKNKFQGENPNIDAFTSTIKEAALQNIKKTTGTQTKKPIRWMTEELRELIRQRRRAERRLRNHKTDDNLMEYHRLKATSRLLLKRARQEEWHRFTSTITSHTPSKEIWRKVGAISGKRKGNTVTRLRLNGQVTAQPLQIANCLARHFSKASNTSAYTPLFQRKKRVAEATAVHVNAEDQSQHNTAFSMKEFQDALKTCDGSSPGPDDIHYEMIKQLGEKEQETLLGIYNSIWQQGNYPEEWRKALTIPIQKPGKDPENPESYRPISLTSCLGKVMEKMVNRRLVYILEERKLIPAQQYGFRRGRSTIDVLNILQSNISKSLLETKHLALVSLDLSKAYDTCWRYGIIRWLKDRQIDGRMLQFIMGFLDNRSLKTVIGPHESEVVAIENGVPQGAVLSVTLFLIAIADICRLEEQNCEMIGYADDWYLFTSQKHIKDAEPVLQKALDNIERWTQKTGFNISIEKTKGIVFTRSRPRNGRPALNLKLQGQQIEEVMALKILGLTFDCKLNWNTHIKDAKTRAKKRLNILRCLAGTEWGADRDVLLRTHSAVVLSALRYGETAYGSATETKLKDLETVHNAGVRMSIGAHCTTRVSEILKEAGMRSLAEIREKAVAITGIRIREKPAHPLRERPNAALRVLINRKPHLPVPLEVRVEKNLCSYGLQDNIIHPNIEWSLAPWQQLSDEILDTEMLQFSKKNTTIIMQNFQQQMAKYDDFVPFYTDGSKTEEGVGCSAVVWYKKMKRRLPAQTSVYSAEATAIYDAGKEELIDWEKHLILTDSLSTILAIQNNNKNPLIQKITKQLHDGGGNLRLKWIPGHSGIEGNEEADQEAKAATTLSHSSLFLTSEDAVAYVKKMSRTNKPHVPKDITRKEQVALARWRMGYPRETRGHLIEPRGAGHRQPLCQTCDLPRTCQHILLHCTEHTTARLTTGLTDRYKNGDETETLRLVLFLRETGLISRL
jgi:ribonuclease HI